jgi:hypothetical protein
MRSHESRRPLVVPKRSQAGKMGAAALVTAWMDAHALRLALGLSLSIVPLSGCGNGSTSSARLAESTSVRQVAAARGGEEETQPSRAPRLATSSVPEGLAPLSESERATLGAAPCTTEVRQLAATAAPAGGGAIGGATRLLEVLSTAPPSDCVALAIRDTTAYLAQLIASEATSAIPMIARGMISAASESGALCASVPPTPSDLASLRSGATSADAVPAGWRCAGAHMLFDDPLRYQYEVITAPDGRSAEIVARGYPVAGRAEPDELFARVSLDEVSASGARSDDGEPAAVDVYRR